MSDLFRNSSLATSNKTLLLLIEVGRNSITGRFVSFSDKWTQIFSDKWTLGFQKYRTRSAPSCRSLNRRLV
jgi:hypothetical protein